MDSSANTSIHYEPLNAQREEIRVLTVDIPSASGRQTGGRDHFNWQASAIVDLRWKASAVRLALTDDPICCTLDTVSLKDTINDSGTYQPGHNQQPPWNVTGSIPMSGADVNERTQVIELPGWRGPGTPSIHPFNGVPTLDHPIPFVPRFTWGDYEALSYTWGDDKRSGSISVNGQLIPVQKNVEKSLRRLRALPETQYGMKYWIDVICINQADIHERNEQVKRMQEVYSKAWSVAVWLGDEADESNEAIDFISGFAHLSAYSPRECSGGGMGASIMRDVRWEPLMSLFQRPYWQRVWIVQELAMNSNLTIFMCGDRAFYREELEPTIQLCIYGHAMIKKSLYPTELPEVEAYVDVWNVVARLERLLDPAGTDVVRHLTLSRQAAATDERDKIYGILGLLPTTMSSRIVPDYTISSELIYQQFAQILLDIEGLDGLLAWASGLDGRHGSTWIPDWTVVFPRNHLQWLRKRRANGNTNMSARINNIEHNLVCQGLLVDSITSLTIEPLQTSDLLSSAIYEPVEPRAKNWDCVDDPVLCEALNRVLLLEHPGRSSIHCSLLQIPWVQYQYGRGSEEGFSFGEDRTRLWKDLKPSGYLHAFNKFRKMNADFLIRGQKLQYFFPEFHPHYYMGDHPSGPLDRSKDSRNLAQNLKLCCVSLVRRRLFTTTSGLFGLAPDTTRPGDVVAILGSPYPVILRPRGDHYQLVGECFLHGFMDGEAFDEHGTARFPAKEFVLY